MAQAKEILNIMGKSNAYNVLELFYKKQKLKFSDIIKVYPGMHHTQLSNILKSFIKIEYILYETDTKDYHIHWQGSCFYEYMES